MLALLAVYKDDWNYQTCKLTVAVDIGKQEEKNLCQLLFVLSVYPFCPFILM